MTTSAEPEPNTRPLDEIPQEQLQVYAQEISGLYSLVRSGFAAWLDVEGRLRSKGVNIESLRQVLSAAHTCSQRMLAGAVPASSRKAIASRLHELLDGALKRVRTGAEGPGIHENHVLGLAALLREELYAKASAWISNRFPSITKPNAAHKGDATSFKQVARFKAIIHSSTM